MRILLNMTCVLLLLLCMMLQIDASMGGSGKSSRIANLPAQNVIHNQTNSDKILYSKLSRKRKKFKQYTTVTDIHNEKTTALKNKKIHVSSQNLQDAEFIAMRKKYSFYSMTQASLHKVWNHPSVQELTLDKIERKDTTLTLEQIKRKSPYPQDLLVGKKSKNSQDVDQYSNELFESDEFFSEQDELVLLENYILYDNHQSLPEQQHASLDCVDENNEIFNFYNLDDDLSLGDIDKLNDTVGQSSYNETEFNKSAEYIPVVDVLREQPYEIEGLLLGEYLDLLSRNDIEDQE